MKILHTSDWHLGRHLGDKTREKEHDHFLNWLTDQIKEKEIDALIVAGDIFDTGYPPNFALKQYYNFLRLMPDTPCRHVIIVGGNHDSVSTLNAPRELLRYFHIRVIGGPEENIADEIVIIKDQSGAPTGIVCAVPFLRTRDIKKAITGESFEQREKGIAEGIFRHYTRVREEALKVRKAVGRNLPIIATGHLFTGGFKATESMREIYVGSLGQVSAKNLPEFDYVALGHFHQARRINKTDHIRYSGSPIPLSFSESRTGKSVFVAEFDSERLTDVKTVGIPCFRSLKLLKGKLGAIGEQIRACEKDPDKTLTPWGKAEVETNGYDPTLYDKITDLAKGKPIEILSVELKNKNNNNHSGLSGEYADDLEFMDPSDVFLRKCEAAGIEGKEREELLITFQELLSEIHDL